MGRIERMERGTICPMAGRPQYNHQTWRDGRNVTRYVRPKDAADLRRAIRGYALFRRLAEQYADEVIRRTRAELRRTSALTAKLPRRKNRPPPI